MPSLVSQRVRRRHMVSLARAVPIYDHMLPRPAAGPIRRDILSRSRFSGLVHRRPGRAPKSSRGRPSSGGSRAAPWPVVLRIHQARPRFLPLVPLQRVSDQSIPDEAASFARTSARIAGVTAAPQGATERAAVSMLQTCPAKISPATGKPSGRPTLDAKGLTFEVIGQTIAKRDASQNCNGEMTTAGHRPLCSRPTRGSKSIHTRSPARTG